MNSYSDGKKSKSVLQLSWYSGRTSLLYMVCRVLVLTGMLAVVVLRMLASGWMDGRAIAPGGDGSGARLTEAAADGGSLKCEQHELPWLPSRKVNRCQSGPDDGRPVPNAPRVTRSKSHKRKVTAQGCGGMERCPRQRWVAARGRS